MNIFLSPSNMIEVQKIQIYVKILLLWKKIEVNKHLKYILIWIFVFLLYFLKNIFKFYQLGFINVCKFNKCVGSHEILSSIRI